MIAPPGGSIKAGEGNVSPRRLWKNPANPCSHPRRSTKACGRAQTVAFQRLRSPKGTPFRQGFGAGILPGRVPFYKPTEVSRQLPQVPSGNRRHPRTRVCASQPDHHPFSGRFTSPLRTGFNYSYRLYLRHQGKNPRLAIHCPWLSATPLPSLMRAQSCACRS